MIQKFCKYQIEWLTSHCDIELEPELEKLIVRFLKDTAECFERENTANVSDINDGDKYEYHYDHTDCIWYRPEARNRCPTTCAQYRDGWNDAMNYIFRDGKGYRPYRRNEQYGE